MPFVQHARTRDPQIIAAIEHNQRASREALERITLWALERGYDAARTTTRGGCLTVLGLPNPPTSGAFGRWTVPHPNVRTSRPQRTNRAEFKRMEALNYCADLLPGVPPASYRNGGGETIDLWASTFVVDGLAYAGFARMPSRSQPWGDQWEPITDQEFSAARTAEWKRRH